MVSCLSFALVIASVLGDELWRINNGMVLSRFFETIN